MSNLTMLRDPSVVEAGTASRMIYHQLESPPLTYCDHRLALPDLESALERGSKRPLLPDLDRRESQVLSLLEVVGVDVPKSCQHRYCAPRFDAYHASQSFG